MAACLHAFPASGRGWGLRSRSSVHAQGVHGAGARTDARAPTNTPSPMPHPPLHRMSLREPRAAGARGRAPALVERDCGAVHDNAGHPRSAFKARALLPVA